MAITTHEHHGHEHDGAVGPHTHLTSVGIDIGSSTSHLMFSQLLIGYPSLHQRRPMVLERRVIARSRILLTPFSGDWNIEAAPLKALVDATFQEAGLGREDIDTGAVIITGEAARRENARKIAELFSDEAGRFVCATAGPNLETIMAAHGSGAVLKSREEGLRVLNIDVGGGTTKVSVIDDGRIRSTSALNIGARLLAYDDAENLTRLEKAGRRFLADLGYDLRIGVKVEEEFAAAWLPGWPRYYLTRLPGRSRRGTISMSLGAWPVYRRLMAFCSRAVCPSTSTVVRRVSLATWVLTWVKKLEKKPSSMASRSLTLAKAFAPP